MTQFWVDRDWAARAPSDADFCRRADRAEREGLLCRVHFAAPEYPGWDVLGQLVVEPLEEAPTDLPPAAGVPWHISLAYITPAVPAHLVSAVARGWPADEACRRVVRLYFSWISRRSGVAFLRPDSVSEAMRGLHAACPWDSSRELHMSF
jgi:hypothetical protein